MPLCDCACVRVSVCSRASVCQMIQHVDYQCAVMLNERVAPQLSALEAELVCKVSNEL